MSELPGSAIALRDALRRGDLSAREATSAYLARIEAERALGAFVSIDGDRAIDDADAADARLIAARHDHDPAPSAARLLGLPIAHKDLSDASGFRTTHGSAALQHRVATQDSPAVATLRAAGCVTLGKTQVPEFGLTSYSENRIAPPARNPLDRERTPGGSSGGSAAAVAAGLLPIAPGTDGGGSIRIPALACGLVGLKPGLGAVPTDLSGGMHDDFGAPRLAVTGPIARDARDAALLFDALRGAQGEPAIEAVHRAGEVTGVAIAMSDASPFETAHPVPLSPEARAAYALAAERLAALGHRVAEAEIRHDPRYPEAFSRVWTSGLAELRVPPAAAERLMPLTARFRERAVARGPLAHREAAEILRGIAAGMREQWGRTEVVLTPGLAMVPPRIGAFLELDPDDDYRLQCEWAPYTSMVNVAGLPAIAVPMLTLPSGLSMGVQLIGRTGSEVLLLQLAEQLTT
ncbi:amidase [Leucobacter sp. CSA2]|uniref:Amidase n=1 Tax=Leucobacter edaphi TaxID=2796472 RepID=A0A934QEW6_9MICO|nr:amidase [Leucobacter edaphi]MBK0421942.1 amidase [Leucobacter edaphi]